MPEKKYEKIAEEVLQKVGGSSNVKYLEHCSTRLRFNLVDNSKADIEGLKAIKGVMAVIVNAQFQVVIGQDVTEVYDVLAKSVTVGGAVDVKEPVKTKKGFKKYASIFLDFLIGVFNPLVPALTGAGLVKSIFTILVTAGVLTKNDGIYQVFIAASDAVFYFLPVIIAVTTAKKLGCDKIVALAIAAVTLLPAFTTAVASEAGVSIFGLMVPNYSYSSQIFPAILTVVLMAAVEKSFRKVCPKPLRIILVPVVCFLVVTPISVLFLSPLGFKMGELFTAGLLSLHSSFGWIIVAILGAILPFLTAVGMHKPLVPYATAAFASTGFDYINAPAKIAHNISESGACFAVALKTKDADYRAVAFSAGISAFFGISEPALYGVTLQNKKAMAGVVIAGFISAMVTSLLHLRSTVMMGTGILGIPQFIDPANPNNLYVALLGYVLALSISFAVTFLLYKEEK